MTERITSLQRVNRRWPWIKSLFPISLRRLVLVHLVGVGNGYAPPASRQWLEVDVLPVLPKLGFRRALFVGVAPYTFHYERIFSGVGGSWTTADVSPGARVWGARRHVVAPVQQVHLFFGKEEFDSVILNGVFGFGVNTISEMNETIESVKGVLRSGGLLLLGWNTDLTADPLALDEMRRGFRPADDLPLPSHREFAGESHVYDFQVREPQGGIR
jgi:hypothetical protein